VGAVDGVLHLAGLADLQYVAQVRRVGSLCYALRLAVLYAVSPTQRTRALVGRWAAHDSAKKSFEFSALFGSFSRILIRIIFSARNSYAAPTPSAARRSSQSLQFVLGVSYKPIAEFVDQLNR
jgi:hypothetical protein